LDSKSGREVIVDNLHRIGKDENFMYPEYVIQEEMLSETARLRATLKESDSQIEALEQDNVRLR
jgi:hypothetical protein